MIVLDASAAVELFAHRAAGARVDGAIRDQAVTVPGHFDIETYGALRRLERRGLLAPSALEAAVVALMRFAAQRVEPRVLLRAIHELGPRFAPADAAYVALARGLEAELVTCDEPLARACSGIAKVRLL